MAFADKFKAVDDLEVDREFAERVEQLSGCKWPPLNEAEATVILTRAGWTQQRIEQWLQTVFGVDGLDAGELPDIYLGGLAQVRPVNKGGQEFPEYPIFSASLIAGLERWHREHQSADPPQLTADNSNNGKQTASALPDVDLQLNQIRFMGECHNVTSDGALLIHKLVETGDWFSASSIISKPSAVKDALPEPLKALIETEKGKGYRLKRVSAKSAEAPAH